MTCTIFIVLAAHFLYYLCRKKYRPGVLLNANSSSNTSAHAAIETVDKKAAVVNELDRRFNTVGSTYKTWLEFYNKHIDRQLCDFEEFQKIR